jgi:hypothetical protein
MFISDSMQPEGYEYLNNKGPKYELLENQYEWRNKNGINKYDNSKLISATATEDDEMEFDFALSMAEIAKTPLTRESKHRFLNKTAEDAMLKHLGENYVCSDTVIKNEKQNRQNGREPPIGSDQGAFMRYKEIPFWQHLPREGVDTDINETLGFGAKETNNHVRGWDMAKLTDGVKSYPKYYGAMNYGKN